MSDQKQKDFLSNERELTLVSRDCEKDCETAPLPGGPIQRTSQSNCDGTLSQQEKKQPARCSLKKAICAVLSVTTLVMAIGVTIPVLFYFLFVGQGGTQFLGREPLQLERNGTDTKNQSLASGGSSGSGNLTNQTECREDFYLGDDGFCRAQCGQFEYWSDPIETVFSVLLTIAVVIGTVVGVVVLVLSCVKQKKLLTYPSIFIVYQMVTIVLLDFSILIGRFNQTSLFCSSIDLEESFRNPTAFCSFSGVVSMYTNLQLSIWVFFHVVSIFWSLKFPLHYRTYQRSGKIRYIHAAMLITGILVPVVSASVPFSDNGYGYSFAVPPVLCFPVNLSFYANLLGVPFLVLYVITVVLFLNVFWIIIKSYGKMSKHSMMVPEAKILFHISVVLIGGVIITITADVFYYSINEITETLSAYLDCESIPDMTCDRSSFDDAYRPFKVLFNLAYIGLVLYPNINLIYIVEIQKVKKWFKSQQLSKHKSTTTSDTSVQ